MSEFACTCDQHGDFCLVHPNCACGCPRHAHTSIGEEDAEQLGACAYGSLNCHGCDRYRAAKSRRFFELNDEQLEEITSVETLRLEYQALRAHHIEEATAMLHQRTVLTMRTLHPTPKPTTAPQPNRRCCLASGFPGGQHSIDCTARRAQNSEP